MTLLSLLLWIAGLLVLAVRLVLWVLERRVLWRERALASAPHRPRLPLDEDPAKEDDLLFTHAQVVNELSPEVRRALFGPATREPDGLEGATVWWRGQEHRLETELLDGPIGDLSWDVFRASCSGCDWTLSARREIVQARFHGHAEELIEAGHVLSRTPFKTRAGGRGTKVYCSCGWYQHLTHRDLLTPDRCAAEHLRETAARELKVKIEGHERWVAQLAKTLQLPVTAEPVASVVPLVLRTDRPEQVRLARFCEHEDTIELRTIDGHVTNLCTRCEARLPARPTRPSPTTGERRG